MNQEWTGAVGLLTEALRQAGVSMHGSLIEPNGVGFIVQHHDGSTAVKAIHDVLLSSKVSA